MNPLQTRQQIHNLCTGDKDNEIMSPLQTRQQIHNQCLSDQ